MMQRHVQASYCRAPNLAVRVLGWQGVASTQLQVLDMQCSCKQQVSFTSLYMQWLCLLKLDCDLTPISCSLFHFCPNLARLPHHVQLVGQLNDFFMAVHADLSICIQVPIFFSLVVCLASNKKKGPGKLNNFLNGNKHMQGWNPQKPIEQDGNDTTIQVSSWFVYSCFVYRCFVYSNFIYRCFVYSIFQFKIYFQFNLNLTDKQLLLEYKTLTKF